NEAEPCPLASVAVHMTVVVPSAKVLPEAGVQVGVSVLPCQSLALGLKVTAAPIEDVASAVMFEGTVTVGGPVTVTTNDAVARLFARSLAVQVTVVLPAGNRLPEAWSHDGVIGPST